MRRKQLWISISLLNLCLVAAFGFILRTKFIFYLPNIDFQNFESAHSHFAFGGWVALALMILMIDHLLTDQQKQKKIYQWLLIGVQVSSLGMLVSFPFRGYAFFSIVFSTMYILFTYGFAWQFIRNLRHSVATPPVKQLSIVGLLALVISSAGPFTLAYMMATKTGTHILFHDAVFSFMHFQYNGFFTFSLLALLIHKFYKDIAPAFQKRIRQFVIFLSLSLIPSLFATLLSESIVGWMRPIAFLGSAMLLITLVLSLGFIYRKNIFEKFQSPIARVLLKMAIAAFLIKLVLQIAIATPELKILVFGFRPIIIGFLHLVFLAFVSFSLLAHFAEDKIIVTKSGKRAIIVFTIASLLNETILLIQGIDLMSGQNREVYPWLLWFAAMMLVTGAVLIFISVMRKRETIILKT